MSGERLISTGGQAVPANSVGASIAPTANIACASVTTTGPIAAGTTISAGGDISTATGDINAPGGQVNTGNVAASGTSSANSMFSTTTVNGDQVIGGHELSLIFTEAEPASPASPGFVFFIDNADGKLKAKGHLGTVTILAVP